MTLDKNTEEKFGICKICKREEISITFHHLIPRTLHKNKWFKKRYNLLELNKGINICIDCHTAIHGFIKEKELGKSFNNINSLLLHPKIKKFAIWIHKQKNHIHSTVCSNGN